MLNTNLDSFVTPDLAFFAPIDAVGTFANNQYCVWNGMIGSAPAHPVLTNVIEWMVNRVSSRSDMYDLERSVCKYSGIDKLESWKVRAEPGLMLSGPCALGLAVNNALGHEPLSKFRPGLLKGHHIQGSNDDGIIGNVMILLVSSDSGRFEFNCLGNVTNPYLLHHFSLFRRIKMTLEHSVLVTQIETFLLRPLTWQASRSHQ